MWRQTQLVNLLPGVGWGDAKPVTWDLQAHSSAPFCNMLCKALRRSFNGPCAKWPARRHLPRPKTFILARITIWPFLRARLLGCENQHFCVLGQPPHLSEVRVSTLWGCFGLLESWAGLRAGVPRASASYYRPRTPSAIT